jgi:hypothetical protein
MDDPRAPFMDESARPMQRSCTELHRRNANGTDQVRRVLPDVFLCGAARARILARVWRARIGNPVGCPVGGRR